MATETTTRSEAGQRGLFLTIFAVLLFVLAFSDATKALQHLRNPHLGLVLFGNRFETTAANLMLGLPFGAFLAAYAYGIWNMKRWALPLGVSYAFYVPVNLVLFWFINVQEQRPPVPGILVYLAVSLTGSIGTALYLAYHRHRLS